MLAQSAICLSLLLLLLLLPGQLLGQPTILQSETAPINFVSNLVDKLNRTKSIQTLLLIKRRQDNSCYLSHMNPSGIPALRLDESASVCVKDLFNSDSLVLTCLSELADAALLSRLGLNLHRMRETPIIIWLSTESTQLPEMLLMISERAQRYNLINLLVLQPIDKSITAHRLQPFPRPTFKLVNLANSQPVFPTAWLDFRQKQATTVPSLYPPGTFLVTDRLTGTKVLGGYVYSLITEFARKHNIQLQPLRPLNESVFIDDRSMSQLVESGQIDLPMHTHIQSTNLGHTVFADVARLFIVVPCGQEMRVGDVYRQLRSYLLIILAAYLLFALLETLFLLADSRIRRRRSRQSCAGILVNLPAFAGVLGLPVALARYRSPALRQFVMIMSLFSLVIGGFFNANLSALLTKHPQHRHIQNLDELRQSGINVIFDRVIANVTIMQVREKLLLIGNIQFEPSSVRNEMLFGLNSSNAYQVFSKMWQVFNRFQLYHNRKSFCRSAGLNLFYSYPIAFFVLENSVYKRSLTDFIHRTHDVGLIRHWSQTAMRRMAAAMPRHPHLINTRPKLTNAPLTNEDLLWAWKLVGLCYAAAGLVFVAELALARWPGRKLAKMALRV